MRRNKALLLLILLSIPIKEQKREVKTQAQKYIKSLESNTLPQKYSRSWLPVAACHSNNELITFERLRKEDRSTDRKTAAKQKGLSG